VGNVAVGGVSRFADVDAVTVDAYGTLLELDDAIGHLDGELRKRGVEIERDDVERGFRAEVAYYTREKLSARDEAGLERLREGSARAFLDELGLPLDPADFASAFALPFRPVPGVREALERLAARGLTLAVVANWDVGLHEHLRAHGLERPFAAVVVSAEVGAAKPDPAPFRAALERLGVEPARAVHVGDHEPHDRAGAEAAGMRFLPAPLATAFAAWS
jgi:putative hydrolase of the HAD superfamily